MTKGRWQHVKHAKLDCIHCDKGKFFGLHGESKPVFHIDVHSHASKQPNTDALCFLLVLLLYSGVTR